MWKLSAGFLIFSMLLNWIGGLMEGGGGILATVLTLDLSKTAVSMEVESTQGFLSTGDIIFSGTEAMTYTAIDPTHFLNLSRGVRNTTPATHATGIYVYTETADSLNSALGFDVANLAVQNGFWSAITISTNFLTKTVPRIITSGVNNVLFQGDLALLGYLYTAAAFCFAFSIALAVGSVVAYVLRR